MLQQGETVLLIAAKEGYKSIVECLLGAGAACDRKSQVWLKTNDWASHANAESANELLTQKYLLLSLVPCMYPVQ